VKGKMDRKRGSEGSEGSEGARKGDACVTEFPQLDAKNCLIKFLFAKGLKREVCMSGFRATIDSITTFSSTFWILSSAPEHYRSNRV
jgi:hypothetical protein